MNWLLTFILALLGSPLSGNSADDDSAAQGGQGSGIIPLAEVEAGMQGVWKTVVRGTEIESFPLEVVGVLDSFIGPGVPIILGRALDDINTHTGPVSGMSGSPVYIEGRLAGAYAYGFPWSRDKTLIGITPIESMMPLLETKDREHRSAQRPSEVPKKQNLGLPRASEEWTALARADGELSPQALPLPLFAGGLDAKALQTMDPWLRERGIQLTTGVGSGSSQKDFDFEAGSPLSVILATGDLYIGGVGTITYREGDRILAYGHPMMGRGSVELPVGGAEIVDVVSSFRISFKLSNAGPPVGTLWQDSTPGIQAELGRVPYMIPVRIQASAGDDRVIEGKIAEDRALSPILSLIYMVQTLFSAAEGPDNSTTYATLTLDVEGLDEPITSQYRGVGETGSVQTLLRFAGILENLLNGAEVFPRINNIHVELEVKYGEKEERLHSVRLESSRLVSGSSVPLEINTRKKDGTLQNYRREIPLPLNPVGTEYAILIQDASTLEQYEGLLQNRQARSFVSLIREIRQLPENGAIFVRLIQKVPGIRLEGENLENLPPSVLALYQSSLQAPGETFLSESILWEGVIPVEGTFTGEARIQFKTEL